MLFRVAACAALTVLPGVDPVVPVSPSSLLRLPGDPARVVAEGILALALKTSQGRFVHDNDGIRRAACGLPRPLPG